MEGYSEQHFTIPLDLTSRSGFVTDYIACNASKVCAGKGGGGGRSGSGLN